MGRHLKECLLVHPEYVKTSTIKIIITHTLLFSVLPFLFTKTLINPQDKQTKKQNLRMKTSIDLENIFNRKLIQIEIPIRLITFLFCHIALYNISFTEAQFRKLGLNCCQGEIKQVGGLFFICCRFCSSSSLFL